MQREAEPVIATAGRKWYNSDSENKNQFFHLTSNKNWVITNFDSKRTHENVSLGKVRYSRIDLPLHVSIKDDLL